MNYVGYSDNFHDAGIAVVNTNGDIVFATHAERYEKIKNYEFIPDNLWEESVDEANDFITYFEDPFLKYQTYLDRFEIEKTLIFLDYIYFMENNKGRRNELTQLKFILQKIITQLIC